MTIKTITGGIIIGVGLLAGVGCDALGSGQATSVEWGDCDDLVNRTTHCENLVSAPKDSKYHLIKAWTGYHGDEYHLLRCQYLTPSGKKDAYAADRFRKSELGVDFHEYITRKCESWFEGYVKLRTQ